MVKVRASKSKRKSSKQRHKIEKKKREHKRDLRKAAKALKEKGLMPRSKKGRDMAKLALKISNADPEKEKILGALLVARENARVEKQMKRQNRAQNGEDANGGGSATIPKASNKRQLLYIATRDSFNFKAQFLRSLNDLVFPGKECEHPFELPCVSYVITLDSRFAVQCVPWTLLDAIVDIAASFDGKRKVLVLFTLTKVDLVSAPALVSQVSLLSVALAERYPSGLGKHIVAAFTPFSVYHEKLSRHFLRVLRQFELSDGCRSANCRSNMDNKVCAFVVGLPNTGRRALMRTVAGPSNETSVSVVPMRAAQLQLVRVGQNEEEQTVQTKFAFPNAKSVTLVQFPEDTELIKELRTITGGDIMFRSPAYVEKIAEPESIACVLFEGISDKISVAQAFCQPAVRDAEGLKEGKSLKEAEKFFRFIGQTVRQEKGFYISPLFSSGAGTMGKSNSSSLTAHVDFTSGQQRSQATLLDATYSNATPNKLVRISSVVTVTKGGKQNKHVKRADHHNVLRLGARTFLRELCQSRHVPWAVMRAPHDKTLTPAQVAECSELFNLSVCSGAKLGSVPQGKSMDHLNALVSRLSSVMKDTLIFLPNNVVEMSPDFIVPPQYSLTLEDEETDSDDDQEEESEVDAVEAGDEEDDDEEDDDEEDEEEF